MTHLMLSSPRKNLMPRNTGFTPTIIISIALISSLSDCSGGGGGSPMGAAPASIGGNYSGSLEDSVAGSGSVGLSITQSGSRISGQFADTFSNPAIDNGGSLSGTVTGSTFSGSVKSVFVGACGFSIKGSLSGSTLSGTYSATSCSGVETGTFSVTTFTPPSVAGTYSGTEVDSIAGSGSLSATVTQSGSVLGGSYSNSFGGSGTVFGQFVNSGTALFALLPPSASDCPGVASATINPPTISGSYEAVYCSVSDTGTFTLTL